MNKTFAWRLLTPGELTDVYLQQLPLLPCRI